MSDVEVLLAGLEVESLAELKRLVDAGREMFRIDARRAELAATVAALPDARERLIAALELSRAYGQSENGLFVYVSFIDGGDPINVGGVWASEADAFLAGESDREEGIVQVVLPLFVSNELARLPA